MTKRKSGVGRVKARMPEDQPAITVERENDDQRCISVHRFQDRVAVYAGSETVYLSVAAAALLADSIRDCVCSIRAVPFVESQDCTRYFFTDTRRP